MARFNVFLDTNIFINAKYNFAGGSLASLKRLCDKDTVALFTNDTTIVVLLPWHRGLLQRRIV